MNIEAIVEDPGWEQTAPAALCTAVLHAVADETRDPRLRRQVSALFTTDEDVRVLNRDYRSKDRPTNVLSFPADEVPGLPEDAQPLGDLALALETCRKEASDKRMPMKDHTAHLLAHGLLHLLGYDHLSEAEAEVMEALERRILARLGIGDPYAETPGR